MMYIFPNKIKKTAIAFMIVGFLGLAYGFLSAPKTIEESKAMIEANHGDHHGEEHDENNLKSYGNSGISEGSESHHNGEAHLNLDTNLNNPETHNEGHEDAHDKHVFHQLANKPWAAFYVSAFFFFMVSLGVLAFYAIQRASQAGWSPVLFRVMEGITAYMLPGGIIVLVILFLSSLHLNHLFIWMDPEVVAHDKLIAGKTGYLNTYAI